MKGNLTMPEIESLSQALLNLEKELEYFQTAKQAVDDANKKAESLIKEINELHINHKKILDQSVSDLQSLIKQWEETHKAYDETIEAVYHDIVANSKSLCEWIGKLAELGKRLIGLAKSLEDIPKNLELILKNSDELKGIINKSVTDLKSENQKCFHELSEVFDDEINHLKEEHSKRFDQIDSAIENLSKLITNNLKKLAELIKKVHSSIVEKIVDLSNQLKREADIIKKIISDASIELKNTIMTEVQSAIEIFKTKIDSLDAEHKKRFDKFDKTLDSHSKMLDGLKQTVDNIEPGVKEIQEDIKAFKDDQKKIEYELRRNNLWLKVCISLNVVVIISVGYLIIKDMLR